MKKSAILGVLILVTITGLSGAQAAHAYTWPLIWVGSPVEGTWGISGVPSTTPVGGHHKLVKASPRNDWSVDLSGTGSGQTVYLYVAPSNSGLNNRVTTKVTQIIDNSTCKNGGGGDFVTVGVYFDGILYGHATYAHLNRNTSLYVGKAVPRWGANLGTVAFLSGSATGGPNCWTGPHVHFEMRASSQWACWNKGYTPGYTVRRTNFLGFVAGPLNPNAPTACP
jgi:hypothetical protein